MEQTWDGVDRRAPPSVEELADNHEITHRQIYKRLSTVEIKVDRNTEASKEVIAAFDSAKAAFHALEIIGKIAKPLLWLGGVITAIGILWTEIRGGR